MISKNGSTLTITATEVLLKALSVSINAILEHRPDDAVWVLTTLKDNIESNIEGGCINENMGND